MVKRLLLLVALSIAASQAFGAVALVQSKSFGRLTSGASSTVSITLTTGDAVIVSTGFSGSSAWGKITDGTNTYTLISGTRTTNTGLSSEAFLALNVTGGTYTLTCTSYTSNAYSVTANTFHSVTVQEYSGVATASAVDQAVGALDFSTPWDGTAITTTQADEMFYSSIFDYASTANPAAGSGYTEPAGSEYDNTGDGETISSLYRILSATGTYSPGWTSAGDSVVINVSLKAAAGGGGTTLFRRRTDGRSRTGSRSVAWVPDVDRVRVYA